MKNVIVGTCGHVDHGKTALIKALTGIDTDRLKEEKSRGLSIEAGFAHIEDSVSGEKIRLGVIDAPGHERFIGNMLAVAGGVGLALLVVAADEGVMPQTCEHFDILRLLGVKDGVIAITKLDLAEKQALEATRTEIKEFVAGSFLQDAPVIEVSAKTGEGLDALRNALFKAAAVMPQKNQDGAFRMPVDRVFTVQGFGTVVTGTLKDGSLELNSKAMLYPAMQPVRIRGLQVHSKNVDSAPAGTRVAVNLAVKKREISRGDVLAANNTLTPSMLLDTELEILESSEFAVKNNSRVHLYIGSTKLLAKVVLLDTEELAAGERGFAQLRLAKPVAVKSSDLFIIRFYSPEVTVGGGEVLAAAPHKHRRFKPYVIQGLRAIKSGVTYEAAFPRKEKPETLNPVPTAFAQGLPLAEVEQIYLSFKTNPRAASIAARGMDVVLFSKALSTLTREKKLIKLDDVTYIHEKYYSEAVALYKRMEEAKSVELSRYREELGTSRRVAFLLFTHFEANGIKPPR